MRERLNRILRIRWDVHRVPKADVVIITSGDPEVLPEYFPDRRVLVVDIDSRNKFLASASQAALRGRARLSGYLAEVINSSGAALAITTQDNLGEIYRIQELLNNSTLILIQNGLRSSRNDISEVILRRASRLRVGAYFAFSASQEAMIRDLAAGDFQVIGSFRSNHTPRKVSMSQIVSYVSTFNPAVPLDHLIDFGEAGRTTYSDLLNNRLRTIKLLGTFCNSVGAAFQIIAKREGSEAIAEEDFYRKSLPSLDFEFRHKTSRYSSYESCYQSRVVVSTSSSLGVESLGRGTRTAILHAEGELTRDSSLRFGWPETTAPEGKFWSSSSNSERCYEILSYLWSVSDSQWTQDLRPYSRLIPLHDAGNSRFCGLLHGFGARSPFATQLE